MTKRWTQTLSWLVVLILALAQPVLAKDLGSRRYVPMGSVDAAALIRLPPAVGSAAFKEQMTVVLWLQHTRTPELIAFVQKPLDVDRFAALLGAELLGVDGIELKRVIDAAVDEVRNEYDALKGAFDLPRPFVVNHAVEPVTDPRPVESYPSGHAIRAIVYARLLAEIFPDKKQALLDLAYQIGYGRVSAGVHYPVDVTAGQTLGQAYADVIVRQPAFREAIARIRRKRP
jgi:acid phosphatase (class A)